MVYVESSSRMAFQHTYKGSKRNPGSVYSNYYVYVPAYLQGFETFRIRFLFRYLINVPAYLQGFETSPHGISPPSKETFQHTYKGSKLPHFLLII